MTERVSVAIVGGGQAGLAMSRLLVERDIDHLVFEKHRIGHAWREKRWDSFCLVTPNWQCRLPHFPYAGDDPDGFMQRDEIVAYLEAFAASFAPPVREGVEVTRLTRDTTHTYRIETSEGTFAADQVVVATGGYHVARIPRMSERLPRDIVQLHSSEYRNAQSLPPGAVLVVGTGQSGCQIAEDLHLAGRAVHLCVGSAPRVARRYRGRDVVEWLDRMGHYDLPVHEHPPGEGVRRNANHYVTGRDGGRDIDLRRFALEGMQLHGRLLEIADGTLHIGDDLVKNLDRADAVSERIKGSIDAHIAEHGIDAPLEPPYHPVWSPGPEAERDSHLDLANAGIGSVIWSMGYGTDYAWLDLSIFNGRGYPMHVRGVTSAPGMYVLGLPWLYTWGSGRFTGVARDAAYLADRIVERRASEAQRVTAPAVA
jgi:putative flavoprotein involved in K+ transport